MTGLTLIRCLCVILLLHLASSISLGSWNRRSTDSIESADAAANGIIHIPIRKKKIPFDVKKRLVERNALHKRASNTGLSDNSLINLVDFYEMTIEVGTPPQKLNTLLDTGSSDLWVYGPSAATAGTNSFDSSKSSSWHDNHTKFQITYVSGTATGDWGTDIVSITGAKIKEQSLAVVTSGKNLQGVPGLIGVGLMSGEVTAFSSSGQPGGSTYYNVPYNLYRQGYIRAPMYSLYLDDVEAKTGSVLFGGIDRAKYTGTLYTIPRQGNEGFFVSVSSVTINSYKTNSFQALLDSGTSLGLLPQSMLQRIQELLTMSYDNTNGYYYVTNLDSIPDNKVTFDFSGAVFDIPLKLMFVKSDYLGSPFPKGQYVFGFMVSEQNSDQLIFGDVFLRNFYVVYDVVNSQIGIAEASFDTMRTQLQAIVGNSIPNSVKAPNYSASGSNSGSWTNQFEQLRTAIGNGLSGILGRFGGRFNIVSAVNFAS